MRAMSLFRLHNMELTGAIPNSLSNAAGLEILDVSGNHIDQDFGEFSLLPLPSLLFSYSVSKLKFRQAK